MWTFLLSIKYLLSKRKEGMISLITTISVLGVALGVASLIIVISVMNGFDEEVRDKIIGTYAHIILTKDNGLVNYENLAAEIKKIPEVTSASAFITGQAILNVDGVVSGVLLKGIDPAAESDVTSVVEYTKGKGMSLNANTIILGKELMKNERIYAGDIVEIVVPYSMSDKVKMDFEVIGSFESGRYDYDANIAVVDIQTAQKILRLDNAVTGMGIKIQDGMKVGKVKEQVREMFPYPYKVRSWMDLDKNLVKALALEKKIMFLILGLIVLVACFNISGSLIMMVMEKTRDIGILKAIGANSFGISFVFLQVGAFIGLMGILVGGVLGVFIAERINRLSSLLERLTGINVFPNDVYYFTEIPVKIHLGDITMIISVAVFLAVAAGIYPAWKASRLDPVEAIRYE